MKIFLAIIVFTIGCGKTPKDSESPNIQNENIKNIEVSKKKIVEKKVYKKIPNKKKENLKKKILQYKHLCKSEDGESCRKLGEAYSDIKSSMGVTKDYSKALKYYEKSCNLKYGRGCFGLGTVYQVGIGIPEDLLKGVKYFKKACDLKYGWGCYILGLTYKKNHKRLSRNLRKSAKYFKKACVYGHDISCNQ